MPRVNQSDPSVHKVLTAWVDSLDSWRGVRYITAGARKDGQWTAGSPRQVITDWFSQSENVINSFPPTIMSVELTNVQEREWTVRTLFSATEGESRHIIPLGILRTFFTELENGSVSMQHPFDRAAADWTSTTVGSITFLTPPGSVLDLDRADAADGFHKEVNEMFTGKPPENITMYVAADRDMMCGLFGLEYYAFPPSGLAYPESGIMMTSFGDPFYPHEIVHMVTGQVAADMHPVISEGISTWLGGSVGARLPELAKGVLGRGNADDLPSLEDLFTSDQVDQELLYTASAAVIKAVYERHGLMGVKDLMRARSSEVALTRLRRLLTLSPLQSSNSLVPYLQAASQ